MPYWVYGHDAKSAQRRDPLFFETEDEADARRQAEEIGMVVEEVELVEPAATTGEKPKPTRDVSRFHGFRPNVEVILTTTATIEGCPIKRYAGIVSGVAIVRSDAFTFVGAPSAVFEQEVQRARDSALAKLETAALAMSANAVVGLQFQFETANVVCVTGTAVVIEDTRTMVAAKNHHVTELGP
jgi:uncharacterized protein YbjQ (UPF0145 family)